MAASETLIRDYYSRHQDKIIDCPFQAGNLKISENACLKRHAVAKSKNFKSSELEDTFKYFVNQGLLRCEKCPIIIKLIPKPDISNPLNEKSPVRDAER